MLETFTTLSHINYWNGSPKIELGYLRESYLQILKKATGNKLIKVIVGQRRSGKSFIVRQFIQYLIQEKSVDPKNTFYLNKELFEFENIKTAADLNALIKFYKKEIHPSGKVYVFIDEVQNIDEWEKIVVSLAQHSIEEYEVYITGSNSRLLSGELASQLSGRYLLMEVFPFSYMEFLSIYNLVNSKENFINYIESSGLPELLNFNSADIKRHYFQSLKDTILLKDIMYRHQIRDYTLLEDLFLFILHNVGNLFSIPSIVKYYKSKQRKTDYTTVASFITYMEEAFIIRNCTRFSLKTKELLSGEKKYYVNDLGFRNFLYPQLKTDVGAILENVLFMHLLMAGYEVKVGYTNSYEVDFVATKEGTTMYIQVTYLLANESTKDREYRSLELIDDSFPKYIVSMDDMTINHPKGIIHQNIWNFIHAL